MLNLKNKVLKSLHTLQKLPDEYDYCLFEIYYILNR